VYNGLAQHRITVFECEHSLFDVDLQGENILALKSRLNVELRLNLFIIRKNLFIFRTVSYSVLTFAFSVILSYAKLQILAILQVKNLNPVLVYLTWMQHQVVFATNGRFLIVQFGHHSVARVNAVMRVGFYQRKRNVKDFFVLNHFYFM